MGTLVLIANAALLSLYTPLLPLLPPPLRRRPGLLLARRRSAIGLWQLANRLNERHTQFAWVSLFGVALTDLYVRLVAMGVIQDPRIVF